MVLALWRKDRDGPAPGVFAGQSLANVYVSMLDAFDTPVERFADSTGKAVGLLA